jgi:hypothetical protein
VKTAAQLRRRKDALMCCRAPLMLCNTGETAEGIAA